MPSRQTTIFAHFSPSNRTRGGRRTRSGPAPTEASSEAGPSRRPARGAQARRTRGRVSESESEGSYALDHIRLSPDSKLRSKSGPRPRPKRLAVEIPLTQRRAMRKTIQDSTDEEDGNSQDEEEEGDQEEFNEQFTRAGGGGVRNLAAGTSKRIAIRQKEAEDDNLDDDIMLYPSPLSPKTTRVIPSRHKRDRNGTSKVIASQGTSDGSNNMVIVHLSDEEVDRRNGGSGQRGGRGRRQVGPSNGAKGKGKAKAEEADDDEDDDVIPIDPPPPCTANKRSIRNTVRNATQSSKSTQARGGLQFRRTTSELEIQLPRLSQEEKSTYRKWTSREPSAKASTTIAKKLPDIDEGQHSNMEDDEQITNPARRQSSASQPPNQLDEPNSRSQALATNERQPSEQAEKPVDGSVPNDAAESSLLATAVLANAAEPPAAAASPSVAALNMPETAQNLSSGNGLAGAATSSIVHPQNQPVGPFGANRGDEADLNDDDFDFLTSGSIKDSPRKQIAPASPAGPSRPVSLSPDPPSAPKDIARSPSPAASNASSEFFVSSKRRDKGKQRAVPDTQISESQVSVSPPAKERSKPTAKSLLISSTSKSASKGKQLPSPEKAKKKGVGKLKSKTRDPDDDVVETEDEQDMVEHLKMDEPERFKSATRLRQKKETDFQRKLRKMKAQRLGQTISESESETAIQDGESSSDSAISVDNEDSFIVPDDNINSAHVQLPHYFSIDSVQTPEFKFKVVFHYLVLLVTKKHKAFPLSRDASEYFQPQLHYWRDRMLGFRNFRVRSQIWRSNFVKAMEKYPGFEVEELPYAVSGCDACHMSGRRSKFMVRLDGTPYNKETHEELSDSDSESESDRSDSEEADDSRVEADKLPRKLVMGRFCRARAEVFHQLAHWEDELYHAIKKYYHDLLRARYKRIESDSEASSSSDDPDSDPEEVRARRERRAKRRENTAARVAKMRRKGDLPKDMKDVDKVTEWMDRMGYQNKEFRWIQQLEDRSGQLEHDKRGDD
ncbi:hypothetical protein I317_00957 [Kwoniella heveanensis CBS 569]|nr:hypothetical protein I317_00957 [Kwoniella heveanensis CBS 569]